MVKTLKHPIGYITGEGCGPDTIGAALRVLKEIEKIKNIRFRFIEYQREAPALKYTRGSYLQLKNFYAQIKKEGGCIIRGGIYARQVYKLRQDFQMTFKPILINPITELSENSLLKDGFAQKIDLLIIRENAQGSLMAKEKLKKTKRGKQFEGKFRYDERLCTQFVKMCYEAARKRKKKIMFLIKGDVWSRKHLGGLWFDIWEKVGKQYPEVEFDWEHEDTWFGYFMTHPEKYDTVVALDIAGDIITDPIAALAYGTRAVTPSANISPDGFMVFQTIHGAGTEIPKGKANPIATLRGVGLMMDYFYNLPEMRELLEKAIRKVLADGYRSIDLYNSENPQHQLLGTKEMTYHIISAMKKLSARS